MVTDKLRKYVLPNIPYVFIGWIFLKLGTAYRLAAGGRLRGKATGAGADRRRGLCRLYPQPCPL